MRYSCHVNINNLPYSDCLEINSMGMELNKCKFQNSYPYFFSNICCWYTWELPRRGNCNVHLEHIFFQQMSFFTINFFHKISLLFQ